jgi:hypothetical protein
MEGAGHRCRRTLCIKGKIYLGMMHWLGTQDNNLPVKKLIAFFK